MTESKDGNMGQFKRFSGESLDGRDLRKWKLWAQAKMAATKDLDRKQRGPWLFRLLDGLALETCEHLTLTQLMEEGGDDHIWKLLEERFPDRLQHDLLAECLKEVFNLAAKDGETMPAWTMGPGELCEVSSQGVGGFSNGSSRLPRSSNRPLFYSTLKK